MNVIMMPSRSGSFVVNLWRVMEHYARLPIPPLETDAKQPQATEDETKAGNETEAERAQKVAS